jgi:hypothetical protein
MRFNNKNPTFHILKFAIGAFPLRQHSGRRSNLQRLKNYSFKHNFTATISMLCNTPDPLFAAKSPAIFSVDI